MIEIKGNDVFKGNKFDWYSWSTPVLQSPRELRQTFDKLNLTGKSIVDLLAVSEAYYEDCDNLRDLCMASYLPFVIVFDDRDRLEIDFSEMTSVRNCFPNNLEDIEPLQNMDNGKRFISTCVSSKITGLDIEI